MKKWFFIIFLILLIGIPTFIRVSRGREKEEKKDVSVPVIVTLPKEKDVIQVMSFSSKVKGIDQTSIFPDLPGRFVRFTVEDGQWVREDEIIAYIELDVPGVERKPISVKSPISGIVSLSPLDRGVPVSQEVSIAQVARIDSVKVEFDIPEKYRLEKGVPIEVEIPSLGKRFKGEIIKASAFYHPESRTQRVHGIIQNPEKEIIPGMFARVWVEVAKESNAITIHPDAVIGTIEKYVFIVKNNIAVQTPVEIGLMNDSLVAIREGISREDTVLVVGQYVVKEGAKLDIKEIR
ncbi:efflux RND transporter periplasmic adaptor subunit [candidate division WOR-3 bacterium]|jgi:membrane fusion protein (multidrug efflux system)|nr:efflux RND transporter periplasmic adaptor subunit [candidate division WOR-3 bacterium]